MRQDIFMYASYLSHTNVRNSSEWNEFMSATISWAWVKMKRAYMSVKYLQNPIKCSSLTRSATKMAATSLLGNDATRNSGTNEITRISPAYGNGNAIFRKWHDFRRDKCNKSIILLDCSVHSGKLTDILWQTMQYPLHSYICIYIDVHSLLVATWWDIWPVWL